MSYLQRNELPRGAPASGHALPNLLGDLICPHCACQIITPPFADVRSGWGRCPRCRGAFGVTRACAEVANARAAQDPGRPLWEALCAARS